MIKSRPSGRRIGVICLLAVLVALPAIVMGPLRHSGDSSADAASASEAGPQVRRLYLAAFEREPDPGGFELWVRLRTEGRSLEWVAERFVESAEFRARYGPGLSRGDYVRLLYRNVLDREPDPTGFAVWTGALRAGQSRGWVLSRFSESAEFRANTAPATSGPAATTTTTAPPVTSPPATTPPATTPPATTPPTTAPPPTTQPPTSPSTGVSLGNDSWLFVGDSISAMSINTTIEGLVRQQAPSRSPRVTNVAVGGSTASTWGDSNPAGGNIDAVLASSNARFVVLALGTNDNHNYFSGPYERLIQRVIAAGRIPVLPHIPWTNGWPDGHAERINPQIDALLAKYPTAIRGADLYAVTVNRPDLFKAPLDVHPNDTGQQVIRQRWASMMAGLS